MHLEVSLRKVSPIAIGRIPPHFLAKEMSVALETTGLMNAGMLPVKNKFVYSVRCESRLLPASLADGESASFTCYGLRPVGPPALPALKDMTALLTSD